MYLLFAFAYLLLMWHIPPLINFSFISSISKSVDNAISMLVFLKHACLAFSDADRKCAGSR